MDPETVAPALRERLGTDATTGLLELLARSHEEERATLIAACTERFERRLVEEIAGVRVQIAQVEGALRVEIADTRATLRHEMAEMGASIRQEMAGLGASIRQEMATGRVELFKWCFLFWIGQVMVVLTAMGVVMRLVR
jgi:hypothetical protein